jgi:hypothetical protein
LIADSLETENAHAQPASEVSFPQQLRSKSGGKLWKKRQKYHRIWSKKLPGAWILFLRPAPKENMNQLCNRAVNLSLTPYIIHA